MKLNSNNLFAFQVKNIFIKFYQEDGYFFDGDDEHSNINNDTFYIPRNSNLGDSNFFSNINEKSVFRLNDTTIDKQIEDDNKSYFTFDLELEKQVDLLTDCDDIENDLNDAKLNLNNDNSVVDSNNNNLYSNPSNLTTPLKNNNNNNIINNEIEDKFSSIYTNTNTARKFSRESLSSLFEKFPDNNNINTQMLNGKENNNINHNKTMIDFQSKTLDLNNRNNFPQFSNNPINYERFNKYKKPIIPYYSFYNNRNNISTMTDYYNNYINISNSSISLIKMMTNKFNSTSNISIDSKSGNEKIIAMIKEQSGSKFIQKKIEEKSPEFLYKLYEQIKTNLIDIINDQYGNYVIQKYVEFCDKKIISLILNQIQNSIIEISINSYGTRALQKMIENLSSFFSDDDINIILNSIKGNIYKLIKDINGNHVIQSIIEAIKNKDKLTPLYIEMNENIIEISKIKQGCCVFPKVLNNIREDDLGNLIKNIINNLEILINDEYGNFIIQRVVKLNRENFNIKIFDFIKNKIVKLSSQKYSSNVIEACILESCNIKDKVIDKLIEKNNVTTLICDQFGNYIIQKCLPLIEGKQFKSMIEQIKKAVKTLNQSNHGRKIYENLLRHYREYFQDSKNYVCNKGKQKKNNNK